MSKELQNRLASEAFIYDFHCIDDGTNGDPIQHWVHPQLGISIFIPKDLGSQYYDTLLNRVDEALAPLRRIFNEGWITAKDGGNKQISKRTPTEEYA